MHKPAPAATAEAAAAAAAAANASSSPSRHDCGACPRACHARGELSWERVLGAARRCTQATRAQVGTRQRGAGLLCSHALISSPELLRHTFNTHIHRTRCRHAALQTQCTLPARLPTLSRALCSSSTAAAQKGGGGPHKRPPTSTHSSGQKPRQQWHAAARRGSDHTRLTSWPTAHTVGVWRAQWRTLCTLARWPRHASGCWQPQQHHTAPRWPMPHQWAPPSVCVCTCVCQLLGAPPGCADSGIVQCALQRCRRARHRRSLRRPLTRRDRTRRCPGCGASRRS
jgi:hypothetical protein